MIRSIRFLLDMNEPFDGSLKPIVMISVPDVGKRILHAQYIAGSKELYIARTALASGQPDVVLQLGKLAPRRGDSHKMDDIVHSFVVDRDCVIAVRWGVQHMAQHVIIPGNQALFLNESPGRHNVGVLGNIVQLGHWDTGTLEFRQNFVLREGLSMTVIPIPRNQHDIEFKMVCPRLDEDPCPRVGEDPRPRVGGDTCLRLGEDTCPRLWEDPCPRLEGNPCPRVGQDPGPAASEEATVAGTDEDNGREERGKDGVLQYEWESPCFFNKKAQLPDTGDVVVWSTWGDSKVSVTGEM